MSRKQNALPDQVMMKLISEIKGRPCLWNPDHDEYNDKYHVLQAWTTISEELNVPEKILRTKWKNLRDMYRKLSKKAPTNRRPWRYYRKLNFLVFRDDNDNGNGVIENFGVETEEEVASDSEVAEAFVKFEPADIPEDTVYSDEDPIPDKKRKRSEDEEDYDIMFLKSLAPYMKQLEPIRKLVVRSRMQDMLLNEIAAQTAKPNTKS